ncbi:MAG: hypothetical protein A2493_03325 [Candidatus Magasanikbacteria bacterium RIFOXYC12_FULL_33_11]|uniref:Polymerase nucleotidyl transferase domain-containing protein n=1 Tax=Candidatus Magasanikbacteria bacterium RIFOXYC12_FULL_33_11 TaxID=1798701 RepID=A0A1F6NR60_9BACT|nr:MAG: hypothetical protein A2493_03325 [Candidatus Magasanikbacteria bacterium RIFOXYC12_FULL_33_11]
MEQHLKNRPKKIIFPKEEIIELRNVAINKLKEKLFPNDKILKIILIGSSVNNSFGEYETPGFRGSLFSDFDFIVFVTDEYTIPSWLDREPDGKPFPEEKMNLAFRNKKFIEDKYDIEIFFIRETTFNNKEIQNLGEAAGIPMTKNSKNKNIVIYSK